MRNKILGAIGIIWGGLIVGNKIIGGSHTGGSDAYQAGQTGAVIFGAIMLIAGPYYFFKKPTQK